MKAPFFPVLRAAITAAEQGDLVVFLESLSTFNNPWRPDDLNHCR